MYWLLTGRLVFEGATPAMVLVQHVRTTPEPPSAFTPRGIPASLDDLVLACLAKDPDGRPRSAATLAESLERIAAGITPWTPARVEAWWAEAEVGRTSATHGAEPGDADATAPARG